MPIKVEKIKSLVIAAHVSFANQQKYMQACKENGLKNI
jgi:hypothetical protein